MQPLQHLDLERWLTLEAAGSDAEAEEALLALFAEVPRERPSRDLADGVMARLASQGLLKARDRFAVGTWRWLIPALVTSVGLGLGILPAVLQALLSGARPSRWVDAICSAFVALVEWVGSGAALWERLAVVGTALGRAAGSPQGLAVLALALLASAVALRLLHGLIATERSWSHA